MSVDLELATMEQIAHELRRRFDHRWLILYSAPDNCIFSLSMLTEDEETLLLEKYLESDRVFQQKIEDER